MLSEIEVERALERAEDGLRKYCWIQSRVFNTDVSSDLEFQRSFDRFYRVRKNAGWRRDYFALMQSAKHTSVAFPDTLRHLQQNHQSIEASFASKLVATLDPAKPVIDRFVLKHFGLRLPYSYAANRFARTVIVYERLCAAYQSLLMGTFAKNVIALFAQKYPWAQIGDLKKLDLVLWQARSPAS